MVLLGFYHDSSLFTSPVTSFHPRASDDMHCERESAHGGVTWEDRSTTNFGCVQVWTLATCVAGKCFIHCAMPLRPVCVTSIPKPILMPMPGLGRINSSPECFEPARNRNFWRIHFLAQKSKKMDPRDPMNFESGLKFKLFNIKWGNYSKILGTKSFFYLTWNSSALWLSSVPAIEF